METNAVRRAWDSPPCPAHECSFCDAIYQNMTLAPAPTLHVLEPERRSASPLT